MRNHTPFAGQARRQGIAFVVLLITLVASPSFAQQNRAYLGFGEIPILADSFKPAIGISRRFKQFELGFVYQFRDEINRDEESFNAQFGQDGLSSSKETTDERAMLQARLYPWKEYFFLSFGLMYGGEDKERMSFGSQNRQIGSNTYNTSLDVTIAREQSLEPLIGFGFDLPITDRLSFITDFTMGWFGNVPDPSIEISTSSTISQTDSDTLEAEIRDNYKSNLHNRYHVFNIGFQYNF